MELIFKAEKIPQRSKTLLGFNRQIDDGMLNSNNHHNNNSHKHKRIDGSLKPREVL